MPGIAVLDKVALNMVVPGMAVLENVIPKSTFSWYTRSRQIYSVCILKLSQHKIIQWNKIMKHEEEKKIAIYWSHLLSEKSRNMWKKRWQKNMSNIRGKNAAKVIGKKSAKTIQSSHGVDRLVWNWKNCLHGGLE